MRAAFLAVALLAIAPACAPTGGTFYYRPAAAAADSAEGKKNAKPAAAKAPTETKPKACPEFDKKSAYAQQVNQASGQQFQQTRDAHAKHLADRIVRVAAIVRKDRKLDAFMAVYPGSDVAASVDLTAEVVRRLDAGEGTSDEEVVADLRKQLADEKARADAAEAKSKGTPKK